MAGLPDGERYSNRSQDDRWAGHVLIERLNRSPEQAKGILKAWFNAGRIVVADYTSPKQRKARKGIVAA